jgi:hypothetical protein
MKTNRHESPNPASRVYSADGTSFGVKTGGGRGCGLDGCRGRRIGVRWPDGKITYPCTAGLISHSSGADQVG